MNFRNAFDQNAVSESLALCLFQYFIKGYAKENLQSGLKISRSCLIDYEEDANSMYAYPEAVNYLPSTVSTDELIA